MEIYEVTEDEYASIVHPEAFYNKPEFLKLNKKKAKAVHYYIFKDTKNRFGLVVGEKDDGWYCPFSAPFGTFVNVKSKWDIYQLDEAIKVFDEYAKKKATKVCFELPPEFYSPRLVNVMQNSLFNVGYSPLYCDINFQFDLKEICKGEIEDYLNLLPYNGKKNLKIALNSGLRLVRCDNTEDEITAYEIIKVNRESRGYPLNMSREQVMETIKLVKHDMFIVELEDKQIAAALVYYVTSEVAQVIYWGDIPGYSEYKPINFLAYNLIQYYGERGLSYLDIGISTDHGIINYGLADFKISIGCDTSAKISFVKDYSIDHGGITEKNVVNDAAEGTLIRNKKYLERVEGK